MTEEGVRREYVDPSRRWSLAAAVATVTAVGGLLALDRLWTAGPPPEFLLGVGTVLGLELAVFRRTIRRATREAGPERLTLASWVTIGRGTALALLAGFVVAGPPMASLAWAPGILYALAAGLDAVDGTLARARGAVTELGARLDGEVDSLTVLVGATAAVSYGAAPVFFLAVGLAGYLFAFGKWWRRRRGLSVSALPENRFRRPFGAGAMVVVWLALLPIPGEEITRPLAAAVTVPFLLNFLTDWLAITR